MDQDPTQIPFQTSKSQITFDCEAGQQPAEVPIKLLAIIGSRTLQPEAIDPILAWLETHIDLESITTIVSGAAKGADLIAEKVAEMLHKTALIYPPDYQSFGRRAPLVRNQKIAESAEACLAVVDRRLDESRGTADCVRRFRNLGKPVWVLQMEAV